MDECLEKVLRGRVWREEGLVRLGLRHAAASVRNHEARNPFTLPPLSYESSLIVQEAVAILQSLSSLPQDKHHAESLDRGRLGLVDQRISPCPQMLLHWSVHSISNPGPS